MQHLGYLSNTLQILPSAQPCHDYRTIVQHSRVLFRGIRVLFALEIFWASHPARRVLFRGIRVVLFALEIFLSSAAFSLSSSFSRACLYWSVSRSAFCRIRSVLFCLGPFCRIRNVFSRGQVWHIRNVLFRVVLPRRCNADDDNEDHCILSMMVGPL